MWDNVLNRMPANEYSAFKTISSNPCVVGSTLIAVADGRNAVSIKKLTELNYINTKIINLIINSVKEFGKEKNHLELTFLNSKKIIIKAIAFFKTRESFERILKEGDKVNLIVNFEKNFFAGREELRLRIIDVI